MNNHFLDGERARTAKNRNSLDIQGDGAIGDVPNFRHCTLTTVNDSETSVPSDTPATRFCSPNVLKIKTASGRTILADEADGHLLSQYSWYVVKTNTGHLYAHARVKGTTQRISMHRLLMEPAKGMVVHHKNNDGLDNRRANLEVTTNRQNIRYAFEGRDIGVHFHKQTGKWRAQLRDNAGKFVSLGLHETKEDALSVAKEFRPHTDTPSGSD